MSARDDLAALIEAHWLKYQPGLTPERSPGECACGAESPPEHFDWRIWQWHNHHVADAILAAGWVPADRLALVRDSCRDVTADLRARLLAANDRLAEAEARVRREVAEEIAAACDAESREFSALLVESLAEATPAMVSRFCALRDAFAGAAQVAREHALTPTTDKGATR